jgi:trans-aconitate 2-methyltransferase
MPDNLAEPSHALMAEVAKSGPWKSKLEQEDTSRTSLLTATGYGNALQPHCTTFDLWRTTYYHRLASHVAIADMLSSTGLKPWLDPLDDAERATFRSAYLELIKPHYPCTDDGEVLYPFPRLFMLCVK